MSPNSASTTSEGATSSGSAPPKQRHASLESWVPQSVADRDAILCQLDLLLAHPLFCQSKRYPALLRFVVEQTLEGNAEQIKERSIGIDVFSRPPGYDANADPVVRVTAGEIRKRLAQYYYDPSHGEEIRIELPIGSYVPVFQRFVEPNHPPAALPAPREAVDAPSPATEMPRHRVEDVKPPSPAGGPPDGQRLQKVQYQSHGHPVLILLLVLVTLVLGLGAGYWFHQYQLSLTPVVVPADQAVDDFWQPMTDGPATVTFCLGEPARDSSGDADPAQAVHPSKLTEPLYFRLRQSGLFALADTVTLTRLAAPLQKQHKSFRITAASEASFAQLREGPAVMIGAFDNLWTMRLTRDLRFGFESIDGNAVIVDRKSGGKSNPKQAGSSTRTTWTMAWDLPYERLARDYAIVARFRDGMTGRPMVIAAGISEEGTEAAGELITNPDNLAVLLKDAPSNWRSMNMEAVIETQVIDGHAGPPQVRALEFW